MKNEIKSKHEIMNEVISKHMKVINDNEYGNFYDKSNDNKK